MTLRQHKMDAAPPNAPEAQTSAGVQPKVARGASGTDVAIRRIDVKHSAAAVPAVRRLIDNAAAGGINLDDLYGAYDGHNCLIAAALLVPQPGRTALIFPSRPRRQRELPILTRTIDACCRQADPGRVSLIQALLEPDDRREAEALQAAGFRRLARLEYMDAAVRPEEPVQPPPDGLFESWSSSVNDAFIAALEASYEQTQDCPGLQGLRDTADVLEGHKGSGQFDPAMWTLLRIGGKPAAVLLLNHIPQLDCVELVYIGIGAAWRGRGLGTLLLKRAMHLCSERSYRRLTLAVDSSNAPALALYRSFGFRRTASRIVLLRPSRDQRG